MTPEELAKFRARDSDSNGVTKVVKLWSIETRGRAWLCPVLVAPDWAPGHVPRNSSVGAERDGVVGHKYFDDARPRRPKGVP